MSNFEKVCSSAIYIMAIFFHRCKNGNEHQTNCSESDIKNKLFEGTCSEYSHARIKYVCLGNGRLLKYVYEYYILVSCRNIFFINR